METPYGRKKVCGGEKKRKTSFFNADICSIKEMEILDGDAQSAIQSVDVVYYVRVTRLFKQFRFRVYIGTYRKRFAIKRNDIENTIFSFDDCYHNCYFFVMRTYCVTEVNIFLPAESRRLYSKILG